MKTFWLRVWLLGALALTAWGEDPKAGAQVDGLLRSAQKLLSEKRLDEAVGQYRRVLDLDSTCLNAHYSLGWIYNEQRRYDRALNYLKKGCELNPKDASMWCELAFAYYKLAEIENSLNGYRQACDLMDANPAPWVGMGDVQYELKKDSQAAIQAYLKAVELGDKSAIVRYRLGWSYNDLGQFERAIPYLQEASVVEPKSAGVWLEWGYALLRTGSYERAVTVLTEATRLDPRSRLGYLYLGRVQILLGNSAQAGKAVEALRKIDVESARQLEVEMQKAGLKARLSSL